MARRIVLRVRIIAFCVVLFLAFSVISGATHFGQNPFIIDNNMDLPKMYKTPACEIGMTAPYFKAYVLNYIKKYKIKYKRLRWYMCITMLQREEIDFAVLYF
jgi:hypothetical protein